MIQAIISKTQNLFLTLNSSKEHKWQHMEGGPVGILVPLISTSPRARTGPLMHPSPHLSATLQPSSGCVGYRTWHPDQGSSFCTWRHWGKDSLLTHRSLHPEEESSFTLQCGSNESARNQQLWPFNFSLRAFLTFLSLSLSSTLAILFTYAALECFLFAMKYK